MTLVPYEDARFRYVIVSFEPDASALLALLRLESAEHPATRDNLRQLGFAANASPEERSISWRRTVTEEELAEVCEGIIAAAGGACVLDVGASFASSGRDAIRETTLPACWRGRFLLHVGGTRWCVVFSGDDDQQDVARRFDEGRNEYYENEFRSATE